CSVTGTTSTPSSGAISCRPCREGSPSIISISSSPYSRRVTIVEPLRTMEVFSSSPRNYSPRYSILVTCSSTGALLCPSYKMSTP
ncbi:hypothetical protein FOZ62_008912, partial [Perkinsus olseni]